MIQLTELLSPRPEPWWRLIKQCGVDEVVGLLNGAEQDQRMFASVGSRSQGASASDEAPWGEAAIRHNMSVFEDHGFTMVALEDTAPIDKVRLGLPGRDAQIDNVIAQVRAMGKLGIPTLCYNWMAISSWARTATERPGRGGALVTGFRAADLAAVEPLAEPGAITDSQLWDGLQYFLDAVIPIAEEAGVRLGMHPDDPPRADVRNVPRIMRSPDSYRRMLAMHPSTSNAITFCQGNFALMTDDVPTLIREFGGGGHIAFVHFRDVKGTVDDFEECFHDEGQTDMPECMRAYADIGFNGPMRPDHVPTMFGESNDRPAYATLGRIFALGYIRGLEQSAYGAVSRTPLSSSAQPNRE